MTDEGGHRSHGQANIRVQQQNSEHGALVSVADYEHLYLHELRRSPSHHETINPPPVPHVTPPAP
jgi:hypothetical protein